MADEMGEDRDCIISCDGHVVYGMSGGFRPAGAGAAGAGKPEFSLPACRKRSHWQGEDTDGIGGADRICALLSVGCSDWEGRS